MKKFARWFSRSLWVGLLFDWLVGIPAVFAPAWTQGLLGESVGPSLPWVAFTSMLLVLLSFFYLPLLANPYRFPWICRLAVVGRLLQAGFFLWLYPVFSPLRGVANLVLFVVQMPLLVATEKEAPSPGPVTVREPDPVTEADLREYAGSTFNEIREVLVRSPYDDLPLYPSVELSTLLQLFNASARNLHDRRDIRPYFNKLIHTHGICYFGVWSIDRETPYTGYFAKGSKGLVIARVSVAGTAIYRGQRRALGLAGKIFPTLDPDARHKPANFVTVSHLSGSRDKYVLGAQMTNAPTVGLSPAANFVNRVIFRLMDTRPGYRKLHPVSTLGVPPGGRIVTPDLMLLEVEENTPRVDADDFRDELRLKGYPGQKLVFVISVKNFTDAEWTRIGTLTFTEDVISEGGDKRLHFWIPADVPSHN